MNMRGTDLARCWPFSEDVKREVAEAILPPISVTKFRWWSHEVEILKSPNNSAQKREEDQKIIIMEKICPVCGVFVTATVNAMNAHIDSCLAQTITKEKRKNNNNNNNNGVIILKPKSRPPKKRSIAEIFAVAPPIEGEKVKQQLKATSFARSLVSAMKTIKAKKKQSKLKECAQKCRKKKKKVCDFNLDFGT